jgi:hypothetical protein
MKDRVDFYNGLNDAESRMYESIDNFLGLSRRFSRKAVKESTGRSVTICSVLGVGIFVFCAIGGRKSDYILGGIFLLMFAAAAAIAWWKGKKDYFPELERANNIIRNDGLEAVYSDLMRASPVVGKGTVSGGRYLFTADKAMCRIENVNRVYERYVSRGKGGSYYACAEVADETGIYQHNMVRLPMFRRDQQFELIRQEIFRLKLCASVQDKNI